MKRYRADYEDVDGRPAPVVIDRRRSKRDQVVCFAVGMFQAKRIAAALNAHEQRRLFEAANPMRERRSA